MLFIYMELKANELRIGNLVKEIDFNRIGVVKTIGKDRFSIKLEKSTLACSIKIIKPIPLTEEWLLKFGFIQCDGKFGEYFKCSKLDGFRIWFNENDRTSWWSIGRKDYDNDDTILILENCKNLHQLQNLFFALTGEELKLIH